MGMRKAMIERVIQFMQDERNRQLGQTTALAHVAKRTGATIVAHNMEHGRWIKETFGVNATSIDAFSERHQVKGPLLFDHKAVEVLLSRAIREIETLEKENNRLWEKINAINTILERDEDTLK